MKKRVITWSSVAVVITLMFGLLVSNLVLPARTMERTARKMIGHSEAELIKVLGQPKYTVAIDSLAGRTVDYPWKGMNFVPVPNHLIRNKVLLYSKLNRAIYVYVDESGIIEYVATAYT
jgi:hypothetical protein